MAKHTDDHYDPFEEAGPAADEQVEHDGPHAQARKKRSRAQREKKLGMGLLGALMLVLVGVICYRIIAVRLETPAAVAQPQAQPSGPQQPAVADPRRALPAASIAPALPAPLPTFKATEKPVTSLFEKPALPAAPAPVLAAPALAQVSATPAPPSTSPAAQPGLATASAPSPQAAPALLSVPSAASGARTTDDSARAGRFAVPAASPESRDPQASAASAGNWRYAQSPSQYETNTARYGATTSDAGPANVRMTAVSSEGYAAAAASTRRATDAGIRGDGTYKVQPNDTYWLISERLYNTGAYFKALAELNRQHVPQADRLQVGAVLLAPTVDDLQKKFPDLCPKPEHRRAAGAARMTSVALPGNVPGRRVYIVERGDNLFEIARRELGKPERWAEIYDLNRDKLGDDMNYLVPGTRLTMPDGREQRGPTAGRVAERSDDIQRR